MIFLHLFRFLATGDSYASLAFAFRMHRCTICKIVPETCRAIWDTLQPRVMPTPDMPRFNSVAQDFARIWQFPNCVGAIDGKHVVMQAPPKSGSQFFNYKKTHSIVLMAVADAHYNFLMVDVGGYGRSSDAGIFSKSTFGRRLLGDELHLPSDQPLYANQEAMPFVFVADEAFPLRRNLMRPYSGAQNTEPIKIFNYRLSRARRVVENAFGIMAAKFRVFRKPLSIQPHNADEVVKACCVLHNFLRCEKGSAYRSDSPQTSPALQPISRVGRHPSTQALAVRSGFTNYFSSPEGEIPWQIEHVNRVR